MNNNTELTEKQTTLRLGKSGNTKTGKQNKQWVETQKEKLCLVSHQFHNEEAWDHLFRFVYFDYLDVTRWTKQHQEINQSSL